MLNNLSIIGRLVADPELKKVGETSVVNFTIACDRDYADKDGQRSADFIDVQAWRKTAEFIAQYFAKGSLIALTGSVQTRNWEDQEGHKRKSVFVNATRVNFCGKKEDTKKEASEANAEEDDPF